MTWILAGLLVATWAVMVFGYRRMMARVVKSEETMVGMFERNAAAHRDLTDKTAAALRDESVVASKAAAERITALGEDLTKDHRDLARVVENDYQLTLAHLDAHHGDAKGNRTKPWRNVPRIAGRVGPNRKEIA